jgi:hypothetical protein
MIYNCLERGSSWHWAISYIVRASDMDARNCSLTRCVRRDGVQRGDFNGKLGVQNSFLHFDRQST